MPPSSPDGRAPSRPKRPIRRYRRFQGYDYSRGAALFLTISTSPRADLFGRVIEAKTELSPLGAEVLESIESIPRFNSGFALHGHVVMPDHVHFNLWLPPGLRDPLKALGSAIRRFKTWTSTRARKRLGIATSGDGVAVYWKAEGPIILGQGRACPSGLPALTQS